MRRLLRWGLIGAVGLVALTVAWAALYRLVPPPGTPLMLIRAAEGAGIARDWRSLDAIAPTLARAVIAAEDTGFCGHGGFDWDAIETALDDNEEGKRLKGGSTISQQTAKNAFLWPDRTWIRKGAEAWFTLLIESLWPKRRNSGGLSEHRRMGRRGLWRRGRRPPPFPQARRRADPTRGGVAGGGPAQPAPLVAQRPQPHRRPPRRGDRTPHGHRGARRVGRLRPLTAPADRTQTAPPDFRKTSPIDIAMDCRQARSAWPHSRIVPDCSQHSTPTGAVPFSTMKSSRLRTSSFWK